MQTLLTTLQVRMVTMDIEFTIYNHGSSKRPLLSQNGLFPQPFLPS